MDLNGNFPAEGQREVKEKKVVTQDAVFLVITGEEAVNDKCNSTCNDPSTVSTSSSLLGSKTSPEVVVLAPQIPVISAEGSNLRLTVDELDNMSTGFKSEVHVSRFLEKQPSSHPEITDSSTINPALDNKPPMIPTETSPTLIPRITRSASSKPKSRFLGGGENEEDEDIYGYPITPKTPLMGSPDGAFGGYEDEEDDEIYKVEAMSRGRRRKKLKFWGLVEWIALVCLTGTLISSLTIEKLEHIEFFELHLWKWCTLLLVIVCGRLLTSWFINGLVYFIEKNYLFRKKVLYFVYGLKKTVQFSIWMASVALFSWGLLFNGSIKRSDRTNKILKYVTRVLLVFVVALVIWLIKNILMKILAASLNVNSFYDRNQESLFHQYLLQTLSGPPRMKLPKKNRYAKTLGQLSLKKRGEGEEMIDVGKLNKLRKENVSSWTKKVVSNVISATKLSTISNPMEEFYDEDGEQKDIEITSEFEAKAAARRIFINVAKPGSRYICEDDLLRFLPKEEVCLVFPLFEGAVETGRIKKSAVKNWVVNVYRERRSLACTLNDAKMVVRQLNKIVSILLLIMFVMMWLISMGLATTEVVLFISSQIFVFGNSIKAVFEGIIFVFYTHPFDVGDRCVIDGVQMIVEEMNIMTTVFLRHDNQKIYYPNIVLATKCIGNMYRSPNMGDAVEFVVDASTSMETIGALKSRIKAYIERHPEHWWPTHRVVVLEIENVDKMKMALYVTHTMNHQNMEEKTNRRSNLILELRKIFDDLGMRYHLLPQEVPAGFATG